MSPPISIAHDLKKRTASPILRFISIIQSVTNDTKCGHISYSWPGDIYNRPKSNENLDISNVIFEIKVLFCPMTSAIVGLKLKTET